MGIFDIFKSSQIKAENESLKLQLMQHQQQIQTQNQQLFSLQQQLVFIQNNYTELYARTSGEKQAELQQQIDLLINSKNEAENELAAIRNIAAEEQRKNNKELQTVLIKLTAAKAALKAIQKVQKEDSNYNSDVPELTLSAAKMVTDVELLHLNCLDVPALRKLISENRINIKKVIKKYESRYTTKNNQTIYLLMVIALESEIQNILLNLKFGSLEKAKSQVQSLSLEYYTIAVNGNQTIAPTVKKFISEIEVLYLEAVEIEYEYYAQKERIKEEQKALKEQMKQEAEERRALEQQQRQVEKEEQKYINEIDSVKATMLTAEKTEIEKLKQKLEDLKKKLEAVEDRKEKIINLQNGQAGNVYIISNIGSFGPDVFKVGMTRRLDPQERVDELGNASVPFPFDVHSFIFSENAVELENRMHKILDACRMNKINRRKEFFRLNISEIEKIVHEIDPAAQFKMTALAEQYQQSQEMKAE